MKCSKCQADNPEKRKFCRECGAKLLLICSQCGSENLPGDLVTCQERPVRNP
ncbi:MAG: zinc ribbon domain-containing protein [Deltaproteobacteria bacterium]|nr:zinc ribbon domain-containing protein [Deltaproteobacteria bacterium]MBL7218391.1 zinc ribbon domain-containing protein [Desulfobacteraceae bacterium]